MELIYQFHAQFNESYAVKLYNKLLEDVDILQHFPYIASIEPVLQHRTPEIIRSLVVATGKLKVLYFVEKDRIIITGIWDCRKNPKNMH